MREITNKRSVYMTVAEIKSMLNDGTLARFKGNRCYCLDEEEASIHDYTNASLKKSKNRIKHYNKNIFSKNGYKWSLATPMVIYEVSSQNNAMYVADGNGRLTCFLQDGVDPNTEIPVDIITCDNESEVYDGIKDMNQHHKAYTSSDIIRMNSQQNGGEAEVIQKKIEEWLERLDTSNELNVRRMLLGESKRKRDYLPTSLSEIKPNGEIGLAFIDKLYKYLEGRTSKQSRLVSEIKNYKNTEFFIRFFEHMDNVYENNSDTLKLQINNFAEKFIKVLDETHDIKILRCLRSNNRNLDESGLFDFIKKKVKLQCAIKTIQHMTAKKK